MPTSVVPTLIDALVTQLTAALPSIHVYRGSGVSDDPADYLMVGFLDQGDGESGGPFEIARTEGEQMSFGTDHPRREWGVVHMEARSRNGDGGDAGLKTATDAAYASYAAVDAALRPNIAPDVLGVTGLMDLGIAVGNPVGIQDDYGAMVTLPFDISFNARI